MARVTNSTSGRVVHDIPPPKANMAEVANGVDTDKDARIAALEAELARAKSSNVRIARTPDGRKVSFYHRHSRFPITAYREGWEAILEHSDEIKRLVSTLPYKGEY